MSTKTGILHLGPTRLLRVPFSSIIREWATVVTPTWPHAPNFSVPKEAFSAFYPLQWQMSGSRIQASRWPKLWANPYRFWGLQKLIKEFSHFQPLQLLFLLVLQPPIHILCTCSRTAGHRWRISHTWLLPKLVSNVWSWISNVHVTTWYPSVYVHSKATFPFSIIWHLFLSLQISFTLHWSHLILHEKTDIIISLALLHP